MIEQAEIRGRLFYIRPRVKNMLVLALGTELVLLRGAPELC